MSVLHHITPCCDKLLGSFTAFNVETLFLQASLGESILLVCSISYVSPQDLMGANPTLVWSTEPTVMAFTQSTTQADRQLISELRVAQVDATNCGTYVCSASDMFAAQSAATSVIVEVGKCRIHS